MDYGIDAQVRLTDLTADGETVMTGRTFAVQLKSTESEAASPDAPATFKQTITTKHLRSWRNSSEPVMLVKCILPAGPMLFQWIDEELFARITATSPRWFEQDTVTITIPETQRLGPRVLDSLRSYVVGWRRQDLILIEPGTYLPLYERARELCGRLVDLSKRANVESVRAEVGALEAKLPNITYPVAVAGPSRVGKSSLLNVLVGRDLSPIGSTPTTAVPVVVLPGARDEAFVHFAEGRRQAVAPDAPRIREYATQEGNPDNAKGVVRVEVRLRHRLLQPGISFIDLPGLDDPDEAVSARSLDVLGAVSAIIYVVDASPARSGGFDLNRNVIQDLKRLSQAADRLFLVCNKADELDPAAQELVRTQVNARLSRFGLELPVAPVLISCKLALSAQSRGDDPSEAMSNLPALLWSFLLKTGNTGIERLGVLLQSGAGAAKQMVQLLEIRRLRGQRGAELATAATWARARLDRLESAIDSSVDAQSLATVRRMAAGFSKGREAFEAWLQSVPADDPFPSKEAVRERLAAICSGVHAGASAARARWVSTTYQAVERAVAEATRDSASNVIAAPDGPQSAPIPTEFDAEVLEERNEPLLGFALGVLADVFLGSRGFLTLVGLFIGAKEGAEKRRKRLREKVIRGARERLDAAREHLEQQFSAHLDELREELLQEVRARIGGYVEDLEREINDSAHPMSAQERDDLVQLQRDADLIGAEFVVLAEELRRALEGVETPARPMLKPDDRK